MEGRERVCILFCLFLLCFVALFCLLSGCSFKFGFVFEGDCQGQRADARAWRDRWDLNARCETHKESTKAKINVNK